MPRFMMEFVIRPNDEEGSEHSPIKARITADSEMEARRIILERAWMQGSLVSRFLSIERVK